MGAIYSAQYKIPYLLVVNRNQASGDRHQQEGSLLPTAYSLILQPNTVVVLIVLVNRISWDSKAHSFGTHTNTIIQ